MARKISEIYAEYKIMPILQEHMLRVAAVASLICDNFSEPLPKNDIITACLLHDMGNILKSNFKFFPESLEPEGLKYWQKIKDDFIKKYGNSEHEATIQIMKELGVSSNAISLVDKIKFSLLCNHRDNDDMSIKTIVYSDARVDPYGVVSYDERMNEAKERYKNHKNNPGEKEWKKLVACGKKIEKQIFAKCKIKPEDINDETVAPIVSILRNFIVK